MTIDTLVARNSDFYNALWSKSYLTRPERFNTWAVLAPLQANAPARLEVGPGLRPRLPIAATHFIDLSPPAVTSLLAAGGLAQVGEVSTLPFADDTFGLVAAFDVIEHVTDDERVFEELTRVLKPGGCLVFSVPLHPDRWTSFDALVGHARRYEPAALQALLALHGLVVERSGAFGMKAKNPGLLYLTVKGLTRKHTFAVHLYNWLFLPLGILFQKKLAFTAGLMDLNEVDEVLLVCRKHERTG